MVHDGCKNEMYKREQTCEILECLPRERKSVHKKDVLLIGLTKCFLTGPI